jgi:CheY-like chemotaxis protein
MTARETRTVMMVDGSATMLYYYGVVLKRLKYAVLAADTPEHALKITDRLAPSLILTAISFPRMNGVDFIKTITGRERTRPIPIIVMTADDRESVSSACLNLGCVAYLVKPVDPLHSIE